MKIIKINEGEKIKYEITGNKITFGEDELTLNLERYERDGAAHIDICRDRYGSLVTGVIPGLAENYAAQTDIPPREYRRVTVTDGDGDETETAEAVPFDMNKCTLTLWGVTE